MGGNALKSLTFTRRYSKEEYEELTKYLLFGLSLCGKRRINVIPAYHNKESYGDCDICFEMLPGDTIDSIKEFIFKYFRPKAYSLNDKVHSFDVNEFQVDLVCCPSEIYSSSLAYFSWNDLGNLVGLGFKSLLDLSYGHEGLLMPVRIDNTQLLDKLVISRDTKEIFEIAEMDYNRWSCGFNDLEDIFKFVVDWKHFNREAFNLENLNHINRVRNKKRKTYMDFLEYLEKNNIQSKSDGWPELKAKVENYLYNKGITQQADRIRRKAYKYKESHKRVVAIARSFGLEWEDLGYLIAMYKKSFLDGESYASYIEGISDEQLYREISKIYENNSL